MFLSSKFPVCASKSVAENVWLNSLQSADTHWCFGSNRIQPNRQEETETGRQTRRLHSTEPETQVLMTTPVHTIYLMCTHTQVQVTNISPQRNVSMAAGGNKHGVWEWCDREAERCSSDFRCFTVFQVTVRTQQCVKSIVCSLKRLHHVCVDALLCTTFLPRGYSNQTHFNQADFSSDSAAFPEAGVTVKLFDVFCQSVVVRLDVKGNIPIFLKVLYHYVEEWSSVCTLSAFCFWFWIHLFVAELSTSLVRFPRQI